MRRSMAVRQGQVDGPTTLRNKACSFLQASSVFFIPRRRVYIAIWRFWESSTRQKVVWVKHQSINTSCVIFSNIVSPKHQLRPSSISFLHFPTFALVLSPLLFVSSVTSSRLIGCSYSLAPILSTSSKNPQTHHGPTARRSTSAQTQTHTHTYDESSCESFTSLFLQLPPRWDGYCRQNPECGGKE